MDAASQFSFSLERRHATPSICLDSGDMLSCPGRPRENAVRQNVRVVLPINVSAKCPADRLRSRHQPLQPNVPHLRLRVHVQLSLHAKLPIRLQPRKKFPALPVSAGSQRSVEFCRGFHLPTGRRTDCHQQCLRRRPDSATLHTDTSRYHRHDKDHHPCDSATRKIEKQRLQPAGDIRRLHHLHGTPKPDRLRRQLQTLVSNSNHSTRQATPVTALGFTSAPRSQKY